MAKKKTTVSKKPAGSSSKKGSAKTSAKKASKKAVALSPAKAAAVKLSLPKVPKRPKFEVDNPARRFGELFEDRQFGSDVSDNLAGMRMAAVEASRAAGPINELSTTPATPGGNNWIELGPSAVPNGQTYGGARVLVTGRLTEVVQHPTNASIIYVGAARGGVWRTTDGGLTWTPMSDNAESLAIGALAISKSNPQVLYAGTGEGDIYYYRLLYPTSSINAAYEGVGVLKSTNGGVNWVLQNPGGVFTGACFYKVAVHPTNDQITFGATNNGLFRTTNGGTSWTKLTSGLPAISSSVVACCDVVIHPTNPNIAYCAFWADGIYKTSNATAATPSWTKLTSGLPAGSSISRISLGISPSSPSNVYALMSNSGDSFGGFYTSTNDGTNWTLALSSGVQVYGAYTSNVFVDISTPDIVYLSGVGVYKATRSGASWSVAAVGDNIHPDNHCFAGHPTNHLIVYAGNDGGIYKSSNGGSTWDDSINEGLNIMQFEFLGLHSTSDAVAIAGTQDNGTQMFRNHPAFYHSADSDGGQAGIDASDARNVIHTYYGASPERSTQGGKFGTYSSIAAGISGGSLFYPPYTYQDGNPLNIAFGTDRINLDSNQGQGGWPTKVPSSGALPGIGGTENVSAIHYVNANLIYAATSSGKVYRLVQSGGWTATAIHAAPLPVRWVWDIQALPGNPNVVILVMAGFGTPHVWRGTLSGATFTWVNISGTAPNAVPDVPCNSLVIDPLNATHFYVGTDIGVFRTTNSGTAWQLFNDGLPNTAVYDLRLTSLGSVRLLRAATHGRGMWERRLDVASSPNVDLFLRDHLMSTGRIIPAPSPVTATFEDPLQHVAIGNSLYWWQCADAKVDALDAGNNYQTPTVSAVDYLFYETKLEHNDPQRGKMNRVYVQVHNRGIQTATNVTVKILYADASPGLPNLPADFWTAFPGNGNQTNWKAIGAAKVIPSLSPRRPEILEWDWTPPAGAATHSCLLIVVDSPSDPIPAANKVFNIGTLVTQEKRVGLKNLHVIDPPPGPYWSELTIYSLAAGRDTIQFQSAPAGWSVGLLFPEDVVNKVELMGLKRTAVNKSQAKNLSVAVGRDVAASELKHFFSVTNPERGAQIGKIPNVKGGFRLRVMLQANDQAEIGTFHVIQTAGDTILGGNTFVLRNKKKQQ
jgi:photosystem II stability/assembly factor-like uncharacterized protein